MTIVKNTLNYIQLKCFMCVVCIVANAFWQRRVNYKKLFIHI